MVKAGPILVNDGSAGLGPVLQRMLVASNCLPLPWKSQWHQCRKTSTTVTGEKLWHGKAFLFFIHLTHKKKVSMFLKNTRNHSTSKASKPTATPIYTTVITSDMHMAVAIFYVGHFLSHTWAQKSHKLSSHKMPACTGNLVSIAPCLLNITSVKNLATTELQLWSRPHTFSHFLTCNRDCHLEILAIYPRILSLQFSRESELFI